MRKLFLGVDGGQSSTTALIGDETGRVLGSGSAGPCNHTGASEGRLKLARTVRECVAAACESAGIDFANVHFATACFGMSGGPEDKREVLAEIISSEWLEITHDGQIALSGAMAGEPGIIIIAGTGSFAFGRNADGKSARAGGWGYIFGDEGGGFDIVRQAVRAALRFEEGWGPATALREILIGAAHASSVNDLLHRFYTLEWPRSRVAALSNLVDTAAIENDPVAREILFDATGQLARLTTAVARRLWPEAGGDRARVAYIGGIFRSRLVLDRYRFLIEKAGYASVPPAFGPTAGALLEAYRAGGVRVSLSNVPDLK